MAGKPIVVGVDGSPESRRAVAVAWKIAAAAHVPLIPVHAVPDLSLAWGLDDMPLLHPEIHEALIRDSRNQMERLLDEVVPPAVRQCLEVRTGPPAFAIAEAARKRGAALVVLGGKEHGALARGLGRSTAHYLVRTLDTPLLVAGKSPAAVTRVLAAVDLSPASVPTVKAAQQFATLLGARLRVVHVVEPLRLMYLPVATLDEEGFDRRSREVFDRLVAPLALEDRVVRTGPAAETIIEEATTWQADLLVVGSHGKGWVDRLLVGSTTERLLNALPVSLLVVPTSGARKQAAPPRPRQRSRKRTRRVRAKGLE